MRKLGLSFLTLFYIASFFTENGDGGIGPASSYEITHAHAHDNSDDHHHHGHEANHEGNFPEEPHGEVPHSHEFVANAAVILASSELNVLFNPVGKGPRVHWAISQIFYLSPSLHSIFRPPIEG